MTGVMAVTAGLSALSSPNLVTYDFSTPGAGSVVIPVGVSSLTVEAWGAGGGGGFGSDTAGGGGGGGAGGYCKSVIAMGVGDEGKTINYNAGFEGSGASALGTPGADGSASVVSSGTYTLTTLLAEGGSGGASDGTTLQGDGGAASGGNTTNTPGAGGAPGTLPGAASTAGDGGLTAGGGGNGGIPTFAGQSGADGYPGRVRFVFTV